mmetsp:Transcript_9046/g.22132  ORF Transcript_9046/g.22132 Transcript_9046/m.22132 type:complete len:712 (-) Transcript_9046:711-2846(-)
MWWIKERFGIRKLYLGAQAPGLSAYHWEIEQQWSPLRRVFLGQVLGSSAGVDLSCRAVIRSNEKKITEAAMREAINLVSDHLRIASNPWFVQGLRVDHDEQLAQHFFPDLVGFAKLKTQKALKLQPETVRKLGRMLKHSTRVPYLTVLRGAEDQAKIYLPLLLPQKPIATETSGPGPAPAITAAASTSSTTTSAVAAVPSAADAGSAATGPRALQEKDPAFGGTAKSHSSEAVSTSAGPGPAPAAATAAAPSTSSNTISAAAAVPSAADAGPAATGPRGLEDQEPEGASKSHSNAAVLALNPLLVRAHVRQKKKTKKAPNDLDLQLQLYEDDEEDPFFPPEDEDDGVAAVDQIAEHAEAKTDAEAAGSCGDEDADAGSIAADITVEGVPGPGAFRVRLQPGKDATQGLRLYEIKNNDRKAVEQQVFASPAVCEEVDDDRWVPVKEGALSSIKFCPTCPGWLLRNAAACRFHNHIHTVLNELKEAERKQADPKQRLKGVMSMKKSGAAANKRSADLEPEDDDDYFVTDEQARARQRRDGDKYKTGDGEAAAHGGETMNGIKEPASKKAKTSEAQNLEWVDLTVERQNLQTILNKGEEWNYKPASRYSGKYREISWRVDNTAVGDFILGKVKLAGDEKWTQITAEKKPKSKNPRPATMRNAYLKVFAEIKKRVDAELVELGWESEDDEEMIDDQNNDGDGAAAEADPDAMEVD